ncbi:hypothetical protein FA95DRAFT_567373 [Auriscalpium vulgare]|uniref:Uncharacterized protein n=1 Tax=Auriscalpium vulgare TaxID=40419 RepID=A0ACB8S3G5_9AGAM|nr:hypothetical protein FA95DRAFT_567373 [Auriscalpium vulgare]
MYNPGNLCEKTAHGPASQSRYVSSSRDAAASRLAQHARLVDRPLSSTTSSSTDFLLALCDKSRRICCYTSESRMPVEAENAGDLSPSPSPSPKRQRMSSPTYDDQIDFPSQAELKGVDALEVTMSQRVHGCPDFGEPYSGRLIVNSQGIYNKDCSENRWRRRGLASNLHLR